ncbi:hypothetical protein BS78_10G243400 [Paspalum vaginatum]|nr:hypothetical protein BS78_10G243400 [Paspalum vaginatum]
MALRSSSRTPRRDADSRLQPLSDGAKADVVRKTKGKADHLLARLAEEGVEVDDKIAGVVDDGIARIKAEAERLHIPDMIVVAVGSVALGFLLGFEFYAYAIRKNLEKRSRD